jgi:hypothetical protein
MRATAANRPCLCCLVAPAQNVVRFHTVYRGATGPVAIGMSSGLTNSI